MPSFNPISSKPLSDITVFKVYTVIGNTQIELGFNSPTNLIYRYIGNTGVELNEEALYASLAKYLANINIDLDVDSVERQKSRKKSRGGKGTFKNNVLTPQKLTISIKHKDKTWELEKTIPIYKNNDFKLVYAFLKGISEKHEDISVSFKDFYINTKKIEVKGKKL